MAASLTEAEQDVLRRSLRRARQKESTVSTGGPVVRGTSPAKLVHKSGRYHEDDIAVIADWATREGRDLNAAMRVGIAVFADMIRRYPRGGE